MADFIFPSRTNSWRCSSASFGFGSKVSMCDGPPSIIRKMQFFAFAAKWPGWGASGLAFASARSSDVKATLPMLAPRPYRNSRRVGACKARAPAQGKKGLVDISEVVGVEDHEAHVGQRAGACVDIGGLQIGHEVGAGVQFLG